MQQIDAMKALNSSFKMVIGMLTMVRNIFLLLTPGLIGITIWACYGSLIRDGKLHKLWEKPEDNRKEVKVSGLFADNFFEDVYAYYFSPKK